MPLALVLAILAAGPIFFALTVLLPEAHLAKPPAQVNFDFYSYFYPNVIHAKQSLSEGLGLVWNPYQNCGQPFFAFSLTALLYPLNWVFAVFEREPALLVSMIVNQAIGGLGAWCLFRGYRLSPAAALCGALAFQLSATTLHLARWGPMHLSPYVWMPWALWAAERILREPSPRRGIALAVVLAVQLLPGFPQTSLFTVQLLALRLLAALALREVEKPRHLVAPLAIGFLGAPLLVAVQYLPAMQVAMASIRGGGMTADQIGPGLRPSLSLNLPTVAVAVLACIAPWGSRHRRLVLFFVTVAMVSVLLSLGSATPLLDWYSRLPFGDLFLRRPVRFLWVTNLAIAALAAFGVDALQRARGMESKTLAAAILASGLVGVLAIRLLHPGGLGGWQWTLVAVVLLLLVHGISRLPGSAAAPWLLVAALALGSPIRGGFSMLQLQSGDIYHRYDEAFAELRERMTPQDRVLLRGQRFDHALMEKSASIQRVRALSDYEPQVSKRYAEFDFLRTVGVPMFTLRQYLYRLPLAHAEYDYVQELLDASATRFMLASTQLTGPKPESGWTQIYSDADVVLYENDRYRPRAFFAPGALVVEDARALSVLSRSSPERGQRILVDRAPASGFRGSKRGKGRVEFEEDGAERVVLSVEARRPGFVHLADQYFPGWTAQVNGEPVEILRSNYAFRAVEVPSGQSRVVFEYRPTVIYAGALVSCATALTFVWLWRRRTP
jgi:hypothetical protein